MENPWKHLPKTPPHILVEDLETLARHNKEPQDLGLQLEILPLPFIGDLDKASVVLLCLNPGYHRELDRRAYEDSYCFNESIKALTFSSEVPFICLDPELEYTGGYKWWTRLLGQLIQKFGIKVLSEKLVCLQYLGYHSKTFRGLPTVLPSQMFTFSLVRRAIKEQKTIVMMRSEHLWQRAVPELRDYGYVKLRNYRSPFLSSGNMGAADFERLLQAFRTEPLQGKLI